SEQYMGNMLTLAMPINVNEFLQTVGILASSQSGFTKRSESDNDYILKAKEALMSVKGMSEMQAHKYLQKVSMNSGKKLLQTAMDILDELN
ncbi:MAG: ANTAR domain-containing protein, partial [Eubacterium sp.]|nr:ANTAR domain-containing protein [Eubacterium sp.]